MEPANSKKSYPRFSGYLKGADQLLKFTKAMHQLGVAKFTLSETGCAVEFGFVYNELGMPAPTEVPSEEAVQAAEDLLYHSVEE